MLCYFKAVTRSNQQFRVQTGEVLTRTNVSGVTAVRVVAMDLLSVLYVVFLFSLQFLRFSLGRKPTDTNNMHCTKN